MVRIPLTLIYILALSCAANSQNSEGPNTAGIFANVVRTGSSTNWLNTSNASASDNVYVSIPLNSLSSGGDFTDYFQATNFAFSIPTGATIDGIVVEIERGDVNNAKDFGVSIVKGGAIGSEDKSVNPAWSAEVYITYGSSTDLWSETWTSTDINASNFGVVFSCKKQGGGANPQPVIDHIRITVHYISLLPIELNFFEAVRISNGVQFDWQTASENDNDYFTIERSTDLQTWSDVVRIEGRGNSTEVLDYTFVDNTAVNDLMYYYRLRQTDNNGLYKFSDVISVQPNEFSNPEVFVYPNPVINSVNINSSESELGQLRICNALGKDLINMVEFSMHNANEISVDLTELHSGIYYVYTKTTCTIIYKQ